jgi:hypothetical protein
MMNGLFTFLSLPLCIFHCFLQYGRTGRNTDSGSAQ